jgi:hypothetical protein
MGTNPLSRSARYGGERVGEGGCGPLTIPTPAYRRAQICQFIVEPVSVLFRVRDSTSTLRSSLGAPNACCSSQEGSEPSTSMARARTESKLQGAQWVGFRAAHARPEFDSEALQRVQWPEPGHIDHISVSVTVSHPRALGVELF